MTLCYRVKWNPRLKTILYICRNFLTELSPERSMFVKGVDLVVTSSEIYVPLTIYRKTNKEAVSILYLMKLLSLLSLCK